MKKPFYLVAIVLSFIALVSSSCRKFQSVEGEIPIYSISESIINPPDTFKIVYPLITSVNYTAIVQFEANAVWKVERITLPEFNIVWAERTDSLNAHRYEIINLQKGVATIGFEGGVRYSIIVNRTIAEDDEDDDENTTLFLEFTKLPDEDYDTHSFNI